jgi:hypothetical protein
VNEEANGVSIFWETGENASDAASAASRIAGNWGTLMLFVFDAIETDKTRQSTGPL